jgi:hypothetical protein
LGDEVKKEEIGRDSSAHGKMIMRNEYWSGNVKERGKDPEVG